MREHPLAIRAWHDVVGGDRFLREVQPLSFHHEMSAAVRAVVAQRDQTLRGVNIDAIFVVGEMRPARSARRQNQIGVAAVRGNPDKIGVGGLPAVERAVFAVIRVAAQQDNFRAVRRPGRIAVHSQRLR